MYYSVIENIKKYMYKLTFIVMYIGDDNGTNRKNREDHAKYVYVEISRRPW